MTGLKRTALLLIILISFLLVPSAHTQGPDLKPVFAGCNYGNETFAGNIADDSIYYRAGIYLIRDPAIHPDQLNSILATWIGESFWCGYSDSVVPGCTQYGFNTPVNVKMYGRLKFDLNVNPQHSYYNTEGVALGVLYDDFTMVDIEYDPNDRSVAYVYPYGTWQVTCVEGNKKCGVHPCGAYKVDWSYITELEEALSRPHSFLPPAETKRKISTITRRKLTYQMK